MPGIAWIVLAGQSCMRMTEPLDARDAAERICCADTLL